MSARHACVLCVLVAVGSARAAPPRIELGAGTAVPLAAGIEATVRATDRVAVDVAIGVMPPPYVDLINAAVVAVGGYDDTTAELIAAALDTAIITRVGVAVRPFRWPLELTAGYSLAALGGGLGAATAIEAVTGQAVRADAGDEIPMHSTVHFVQVGVAWRFALSDALVVRAALEYTQPVAASSSIDAEPRTPNGAARIARASEALDAYLDDVYTSYVKAPVLGVSLRWRR